MQGVHPCIAYPQITMEKIIGRKEGKIEKPLITKVDPFLSAFLSKPCTHFRCPVAECVFAAINQDFIVDGNDDNDEIDTELNLHSHYQVASTGVA